MTTTAEEDAAAERGAKIKEAAYQVIEEQNGFAIRHLEDSTRSFLRWQAGLIVNERRARWIHGVWMKFDVRLFHLCGYGPTLSDALAMAKKRHPQNITRFNQENN